MATAPPDRRADAAALSRTRATLVKDLDDLDRRHAELTNRPRSRRQRRRGPEHETLLAEAKQDDLAQRLATIEQALDDAHAATRSREAFLDQLAPIARRLDQVDGILCDRIDRALCRAINDQPAYLTRVLGPLPTNGEPVGTWIDAATLIETYRLEHDVTDKRSALGRPPTDPAGLAAWQATAAEIETAPISSPPVEPDVERPALDLDADLDL